MNAKFNINGWYPISTIQNLGNQNSDNPKPDKSLYRSNDFQQSDQKLARN
ncbi:hypothetical protein RirG_235860 [Rhizophagus irregularis DAOM 197198w]|uniref:Uncharacterized protein n=1 Tax=Rhizophagus irregularis (strain DAOM 197198w) TaxID=1432141 RepID=A0A015K4E9_RHIIW|nr:hypothetical protein RirG_235860 [Rhizophagus irregularis DAOM 197198w]